MRAAVERRVVRASGLRQRLASEGSTGLTVPTDDATALAPDDHAPAPTPEGHAPAATPGDDPSAPA